MNDATTQALVKTAQMALNEHRDVWVTIAGREQPLLVQQITRFQIDGADLIRLETTNTHATIPAELLTGVLAEKE